MTTPTPESQQAALKLFVVAANLRMNTRDGFTQKLCSGHRLANSEDEARGIYTKHLQETFSDWMISDLLVMEVLPEHLPSATPVSESHAAMAEEKKRPKLGRSDWVDCPICGESDMRKQIDPDSDDGEGYIYCVNTNCGSNGGDNFAALRAHPAEEEKCECGAMSKQDCNDLPSLRHCGGATDSAHPAGGVSVTHDMVEKYGVVVFGKYEWENVVGPKNKALVRKGLEAAIRAAGIGAGVVEARPLEEWHEDMGDVLWWKFPVTESPYVGSPICLGQTVEIAVKAYGVEEIMRVNVGGWPGYHTHFTPIPSAPSHEKGQ